jgi:hypothetical protein
MRTAQTLAALAFLLALTHRPAEPVALVRCCIGMARDPGWLYWYPIRAAVRRGFRHGTLIRPESVE